HGLARAELAEHAEDVGVAGGGQDPPRLVCGPVDVESQAIGHRRALQKADDTLGELPRLTDVAPHALDTHRHLLIDTRAGRATRGCVLERSIARYTVIGGYG